MPDHLPYSEKQLLERVAQGDEAAFKILFDTYREKLYRYISGIIKSKEVAEEIVMDVFLKIWTGRDMITEINNFNAFLFRIAYHKSIDFLRAASRNKALKQLLWKTVAVSARNSSNQAEIQVTGDIRTDDKVIMEEYEAALHKAISLLPPKRRQVYQLSREDGLSHEQIAGVLHISRHTVNNHIVESRRFIQSFLLRQMNLFIPLLLLMLL